MTMGVTMVRRISTRPTAFAALLLAALVLLASSGCDRSCSRLAERLCEQASLSGDKNAAEHCEAWRSRAKRVSKESCQAALTRLDQQR
jgi:hypothetical protein